MKKSLILLIGFITALVISVISLGLDWVSVGPIASNGFEQEATILLIPLVIVTALSALILINNKVVTIVFSVIGCIISTLVTAFLLYFKSEMNMTWGTVEVGFYLMLIATIVYVVLTIITFVYGIKYKAQKTIKQESSQINVSEISIVKVEEVPVNNILDTEKSKEASINADVNSEKAKESFNKFMNQLKKNKIPVIIVSTILVVALGFVGFTSVNAKKSDELVDVGIKYLTNGKYESAIIEFENSISINKKNEKAKELLELINGYKEIENLYSSKDYELASDLILKLEKNKYIEYLQFKINTISKDVDKNIEVINEINSLDDKVEELISANKYDEAIRLINSYLKQDLKDEYLKKLIELKKDVEIAKGTYEASKGRKDEFLSRMKQLETSVEDDFTKKLQDNLLSTAETVTISENRFNAWDKLLNDIWAVLLEELPKDEMSALTDKQLEWIAAKESNSAQMKKIREGAHINFIMIDVYISEAETTKNRCYELVNNYMK